MTSTWIEKFTSSPWSGFALVIGVFGGATAIAYALTPSNIEWRGVAAAAIGALASSIVRWRFKA